MYKKSSDSIVYIVVMTALLTAIAVVVNLFKVDLPIAGAPVMRISFAGPFVRLAAILFGPIYGGAAGGLLDIISFVIKPSGAYIPPLTVTAILNGVGVGMLWIAMKKIDSEKLKRGYIVFFASIAVLGVVNFVSKTFMPESLLGKFILSIGKKASYSAEGFIIAAVIGFVLLMVTEFVAKKNQYTDQNFLKVIITIGIPSLLTTTINTEILRLFIPALSNKMFLIILIPRLLEDLIMVPIQAYIIILLINVYKQVSKKEI